MISGEKKWVFEISHPGESEAGISAFTDTVTLTIESGNPGGNEGQFERYISIFLADWFDGATVRLEGRK